MAKEMGVTYGSMKMEERDKKKAERLGNRSMP